MIFPQIYFALQHRDMIYNGIYGIGKIIAMALWQADADAYITGQTISIDGGFTAK